MEKELKVLVCETIEDRKSDLINISQKIWENPELGYEEYAAHDLLTSFLEKEEFKVLKKTPLETSFIARYGNPGGLKIGVLCEYDALPGIGHACGHNLIAEAGIGAALGIKAVLKSKPDLRVELIVFGTPAEEGGGGKVKMIDAGVFDETDICMMSHPCQYEVPHPVCLALVQLTVVFHGKASHAAAAPWEGINALDAAIACYNSVSMLRQQIEQKSRIHGIIVDGGQKPNIIPERSELNYFIRGLTDKDAFSLQEKVKNCARGAALATGCSVEIIDDDPCYASVKTNKPLIKMYIENAISLGVQFDTEPKVQRGSTDMGNVSQIKPSIHPFFKVQSGGPNHTHVFTKAAIQPENQLPTLNTAKSMAMTAVDVICKPELINDIKADFAN